MSMMETIVLQSEEAVTDMLVPPCPLGRDAALELAFGCRKNPNIVSLYADRFLMYTCPRASKAGASSRVGTQKNRRVAQRRQSIQAQKAHARSVKQYGDEEGQRVTYHVGFLSARPSKIVKHVTPLLILACISLAVATFLLLVVKTWLMAGLASVLAALFLGVYFKCRATFTVFSTRYAGVPVLVIDHRNTSAEMVDFFVSQLSETIKANALPHDVSVLAEETKLLRGFRDKGLISESHYEMGKGNIFAKYPRMR